MAEKFQGSKKQDVREGRMSRSRRFVEAGYTGPQNPKPPSGNQIPKMEAKTNEKK